MQSKLGKCLSLIPKPAFSSFFDCPYVLSTLCSRRKLRVLLSSRILVIWLEVDFLEVSTGYEDQIGFIVVYDFANDDTFASVFREVRASTHLFHPLLTQRHISLRIIVYCSGVSILRRQGLQAPRAGCYQDRHSASMKQRASTADPSFAGAHSTLYARAFGIHTSSHTRLVVASRQ